MVFIVVFVVFLKPNDTKLGILFSLCVGLMMEQCLGERKPHQRKSNKSEFFEAVSILGHFRETCAKLEVLPCACPLNGAPV